jgi:hypothetical protein
MPDREPDATFLSPARTPIGPLKRLARRVSPRLRTRIHWWLYDTPVVSEFLSRHDPVMRIAHVSRDTELVMDGFPRSGNSYARAALFHANGIDIKVSTHGHSHRFVHQGVKFGIPVIVLVRDPDAAISSLLRFEPTADARMLADAYTRYYSHVLRLVDSVVVAPFEEVIADFGAVLERCNAKFGCDLAVYRKTPEAERAVQMHIDAGTRNAVALTPARFDDVVPRPGFRTRGVDNLSGSDRRTESSMRAARSVHAEMLAASGR